MHAVIVHMRISHADCAAACMLYLYDLRMMEKSYEYDSESEPDSDYSTTRTKTRSFYGKSSKGGKSDSSKSSSMGADSDLQSETPTRSKSLAGSSLVFSNGTRDVEDLLSSKLSNFRAEVKDGFNQLIDVMNDVMDRLERNESVANQLQSKVGSVELELKQHQSSPSSSCETPPKPKVPLIIRVSYNSP